MTIKLENLTLNNFKGIRNYSVDTGQSTDIYGKNRAGKTTICDAYFFLLFGKDSNDRKDFPIKTLDENNKAYSRLEHEVTGRLRIDGTVVNLRRVYKEKWVTKKGFSQTEFSGHETLYFWNDVPMQQQEYQQKIASIVDENIFKLITNTGYFNALKWQDRREVLIKMAGTINSDEVLAAITDANNKKNVDELAAALSIGKTMEEYRREIVAKKNKIKDSIKVIPTRIEEAKRAMPDEIDAAMVQMAIDGTTGLIAGLEIKMLDITQAVREHQQGVNILITDKQKCTSGIANAEYKIRGDVQQSKFDRQQKIANEKSALRVKNDELLKARQEYGTAINDIEQKEKELTVLREKYAAVDAEELIFKTGEFSCPACNTEFAPEKKEAKQNELTSNFNRDKSERLGQLQTKGETLTNQISDLKVKSENIKTKGGLLATECETLAARITDLEEQDKNLTGAEEEETARLINESQEIKDFKTKAAELEALINTPFEAPDNKALAEEKRNLNTSLDNLKAKQQTGEQRKTQLARVAELEEQESKMAQELAGLDGIEFCILQYEKKNMEMIEAKINGMFKVVKFKLFETQINQGEVPCCDTLVNGVPYEAVNTAGKVQAGIDIINALSTFYNVTAPIFIDNRESVTEIPATASQVISLYVSPADETLRAVIN